MKYCLEVSRSLDDKLQSFATQGRCSKADVLRKAIALYETALDVTSNGESVNVVDGDKLSCSIMRSHTRPPPAPLPDPPPPYVFEDKSFPFEVVLMIGFVVICIVGYLMP